MNGRMRPGQDKRGRAAGVADGRAGGGTARRDADAGQGGSEGVRGMNGFGIDWDGCGSTRRGRRYGFGVGAGAEWVGRARGGGGDWGGGGGGRGGGGGGGGRGMGGGRFGRSGATWAAYDRLDCACRGGAPAAR